MRFSRQRPRRFACRARSRRGFGVIPVIAVFAIAVTICALWTKTSISQHHDQRMREDRVQSTWLAEAGVRRGAARWAADEGFDGETWVVASQQIGRPFAAVVVIRIEPAPGSSGAVRIVARASYPQQNPRVAVSKSVAFTPLSPESPL